MSNAEFAYLYFRELNRQGKYLTVARLYEKHELDFRKTSDMLRPTAYGEKVQQQYEYAKQTIYSLEQVLKAPSNTQLASALGQKPFDWWEFSSTLLYSFLRRALILGVCLGAVWYFTNMYNSQEPFGNKMKFEIKTAKDITQRLDDVKGIDEIKDEVVNIIKMIKDPQVYRDKGAKLHKGVMLFGEPGTGKTLLARAIAGEAGCNFIFCSGSDFDEMFVGVGAKRVRQLFKEARKHSPCIIFIDEIDSLLSGSRRANSEHSSSRATINQILAEMDGFEQNENIMIIGATNHEGSLDPAAVRPGRFDKKIHVPHPDVNGRFDIFTLYLSQIAHKEEVQARKLA